MTASVKQSIISLVPKLDKDTLLIDNWCLITHLTINYKILALVFANRLNVKLNQLVAETYRDRGIKISQLADDTLFKR